MKKSFSKFICIFTIFSMCSNAFAGDLFKYNSQRKLILPNPSIDYKSLSSDELSRFTGLLKDDSIRKAIGDKAVDKFLDEVNAYDGVFGSHDEHKEAVQSGMKDIIGKLDKLQKDPMSATIFFKSRANKDFNFDGQMDPAGTPGFCSAYPQITKNNVDAFYKGDERVDKGVAYSGCYGNEPISVPVKKLVTDFSKISDFMMRKKEQKAREQMMIVVANAMLDQRKKYQGLYDNYPKFDAELKSCLKEKSSATKRRGFSRDAKFPGLKTILGRINLEDKDISEQKKDTKILPNFNNYNVGLALVAKNHFDKRNSLRQEYKQQTISSGNEGRICRRHRNNESGKDCLARMRKRKKVHAKKAESIKDEIAKQDAALQLLMSESPSLFKIENFGGFFSGADVRVMPSDYMSSIMKVDGAKKLASELDKEIINIPAGKTYKEARADAIKKLGEQHETEINALSAKIKDNKNVKESGNDAVYKQISKIDDSLKAICESEGESLQQYTGMFPSVLNQVANSATSKGEAIKDVEDVQAGLCSLYRKDPPDKNREPSAAQTVIGYGLILGGAALGVATFWTGVGAGAGMAIAATGSTMALGGSAVFAGHAYNNYLDAKTREHNGVGMMSTSWGDVRKVIDAQNDRINSRNETIKQAAYAAPDMIGLGLLANSARAVKVAARSGEAGGDSLAKVSKLPPGPHSGGKGKSLVPVKPTGREIVPKVNEGEVISGSKAYPVGRPKAGEIIDVEVITKKLPASHAKLPAPPKVDKVAEVPQLPAPQLRLTSSVKEEVSTVKDTVRNVPKEVASYRVKDTPIVVTHTRVGGRVSANIVDSVESSASLIAKSKPAFKVADIGDVPKDILGKKISWMGKDGVRRYGVVEKVNKKSLRIVGRKTPLRLQNVNGSSISVFNDGRRLSSAADLPDNMMGEMISFYSPSGNRVQGISRGQLIKRNRASFVVRVPKDSTIPINPADASTFSVKRIPYSKVHGDSIAHVSLGNASGLRNLAQADDFANLAGKQVSFYSPYSSTLNKNMYVVGLNSSKKGVVLRKPLPGKVFDAANPSTYKEEIFYFSTKRINANSIAVTEKVVDETRPVLTATKNTGTVLVPVKKIGKEIVPVKKIGKEIVPVKKIGKEVVPYKVPSVPTKSTGTALVPVKSKNLALRPKVYEVDEVIKPIGKPINPEFFDVTVIKPSFSSRLNNLWRKGREAFRQAVKETSNKGVVKRAIRSSVQMGNGAARIIAGSINRQTETATPTATPTPTSSGADEDEISFSTHNESTPPKVPVIPTPKVTPDDSDFKTSRDDNENDDKKEEKKKKPLVVPAPRGNPVKPHYFKMIQPTIQIKQGTY